MKKVKTGIIGCGKAGKIHAHVLANLDESCFTTVCNRNFERTQAFVKEYGVQAYSNVDDMLQKAELEAVTICTPHPQHAELAIKVAKAGVHVLIEKPLASNLRDSARILKAAAQAGVKVGTVSQRRFYEPCRRMRRAIDAGKIGKPIIGTVHMLSWRDESYYRSDPWRGTWDDEGGGVLVNQAPHQFDLLQWYMGPISEIFGYWDNFNHPYIEVDDIAIAVLRFKNGGLGNILVSNCQKPGIYGKVHIHGDNGASVGVQTDGGSMFIAGMTNILEPPINDLWTIRGEEHHLKEWQDEDTKNFEKIDATTYYHQMQHQDFLRAVLEDRDPLVTGQDGQRTVEIFAAIYESQKTGQPVKFN